MYIGPTIASPAAAVTDAVKEDITHHAWNWGGPTYYCTVYLKAI